MTNKRPNDVTPARRLRILKRDNYTCQYCFEAATTVDHVVPHSHDADNTDANLVASCGECNSLASNLHFPSFNQKYLYLKRRRAQRGERGNPEWHARAVRAMMEEEPKPAEVIKPVKVKAVKPPKPKVIKLPKLKGDFMNLLRGIYEEIYGPIGGPNKKKNLTELSQRMAQLSGRAETWSYRALNGAMNEQRGFTVTHEMEVALQMIAAQLDQVNPLQALLVEITAYSINGSVQSGSIITGKSVRCVCGLLFVPHHNLQVYCSKVCPGRPKRKVRA